MQNDTTTTNTDYIDVIDHVGIQYADDVYDNTRRFFHNLAPSDYVRDELTRVHNEIFANGGTTAFSMPGLVMYYQAAALVAFVLEAVYNVRTSVNISIFNSLSEKYLSPAIVSDIFSAPKFMRIVRTALSEIDNGIKKLTRYFGATKMRYDAYLFDNIPSVITGTIRDASFPLKFGNWAFKCAQWCTRAYCINSSEEEMPWLSTRNISLSGYFFVTKPDGTRIHALGDAAVPELTRQMLVMENTKTLFFRLCPDAYSSDFAKLDDDVRDLLKRSVLRRDFVWRDSVAYFQAMALRLFVRMVLYNLNVMHISVFGEGIDTTVACLSENVRFDNLRDSEFVVAMRDKLTYVADVANKLAVTMAASATARTAKRDVPMFNAASLVWFVDGEDFKNRFGDWAFYSAQFCVRILLHFNTDPEWYVDTTAVDDDVAYRKSTSSVKYMGTMKRRLLKKMANADISVSRYD